MATATIRPESIKKKLFKELCGAWANDGLTADEEVEMIYSARTNCHERIIEQL